MSTLTSHPVPVTAVTANGDSQELCQEIYLTELTAAQYLARLRHHQQAYERARLRNRDTAFLHGGTSGRVDTRERCIAAERYLPSPLF